MIKTKPYFYGTITTLMTNINILQMQQILKFKKDRRVKIITYVALLVMGKWHS